MKCRHQDAIDVCVKNNKVVLPCGKALKLYKISPCGSLIINPLFEKLWVDLWWTQTYHNNGHVPLGKTEMYMYPRVSSTELVSTNTDTEGRCVWTITSGTDGPVTSTYDDIITIPYEGLEYVFTWSLSEPTSIAFYADLHDGKLAPALQVDGSPTIFCSGALQGEFRTYDYTDFLVITAATVRVELTVAAYAPPVPYVTTVPHTEYVAFMYNGIEYTFPAFDTRYVNDGIDVIVYPSLLCLEKLVHKHMNELSVNMHARSEITGTMVGVGASTRPSE